MKLEKAKTLAIELMIKHKVCRLGYTFRWTTKKSFLGQCCYNSKTIYLSVPFVEINGIKEVRDTILHEIAHALASHYDDEENHGKIWKKWCRTVGAKPKRACSKAKINYRYTIYCVECKRKICGRHRFRNQSDYYCGKGSCKGSLYHYDNQTGQKVKTNRWGERIK